jgi:hypothetical protein
VYGDVIINTMKLGYVLHVPGVGPNLLSIYCITQTNKYMEFSLDQWVEMDINDGFKVVSSR